MLVDKICSEKILSKSQNSFQVSLIFLILRAVDIPNNSKYDKLSEVIEDDDNQVATPDPSSSSTPDSLVKLMRMFGQKSKEFLATDPRYWKPPCQVTNPDAQDAIRRAKTEQCKRELSSVSCLAKTEIPFPDFIPR